MNNSENLFRVLVIAETASASCRQRLGDARRLADARQWKVAVLLAQSDEHERHQLVEQGADLVVYASCTQEDQQHLSLAQKTEIAQQVCEEYQPVLILSGGDPPAREWAAQLAAIQSYHYVSPSLMVGWQANKLVVTRLDYSGKRACRISFVDEDTVVATMRTGVAEACPAEPSRIGQFREIRLPDSKGPQVASKKIPAEPRTVDIRYAKRLVAGGNGLGGSAGFELLGRFAERIDAGLAASRMAVDLGWIEHERQVGQTGKTVHPELYIACGISGASHHLQGMSRASHIIAINTDANAPIFKVAHLGLVCDLYQVLEAALQRIED